MSGVTGLVDILLAGKLSQRLDLLGLQSAAVVPGPGPAVGVREVGNDVRLLSRAALDRQMAAAGAESAGAAGPRAAAPAGPEDLLSHAGRLIGSVLTEISAEAGPVRGQAPLWFSSQPITAAGMARALADAVSTSGVFYESHLLEFARGLMARSQLQQEPHAAWAAAGAGTAAAVAREAGTAAAREAGTAVARAAGTAAPASGADADRPAGAAVAERVPLAETVHPQAVRLVHQQLDLLASGVFRWSGEAWPGVPVEWSIHEEPVDRRPDEPEQAGAAGWVTTLSVVLPRLGALHVHVTLRDSGVRAALTASDPATLALLQAQGGELARRLRAAGLSLQDLQVAAGPAS